MYQKGHKKLIKKTFIPLAALLLQGIFFNPVKAQNWEPATIPYNVYDVRDFFTDTASDKLYIAGQLMNGGFNNTNAICVYNGLNWEFLDTISSSCYAVAVYQGEVIVGGAFTMVNGQSMPYLIKWDGTNWQHFGGNINSQVLSLKVINNELFVTGTFTQIGGISANSVARWNGSSWSDLNGITFSGGAFVYDVAYYNNEWYVAGNFTLSDGTTKDIAVYENSSWQKVGTTDALTGSFTIILKMLEYNGELIAGGSISLSEGNVGHGIQRWNGTNWSQLGTSLQDSNNGYTGTVQVKDMDIINGNLHVVGGFSYAGNVPASNYAVWDGSKWCGDSDQFYTTILAMGVYHDTVWIGRNDSIIGVPSFYPKGLLKWTGSTSYPMDTCSFVGIDENELEPVLHIYPNPTSDIINISVSEKRKGTLTIFDLQGREIHKIALNSQNLQLSTENLLKSGLYFFQFTSNNGVSAHKVVVE